MEGARGAEVPGRGAGGTAAGPAWVGGASARQMSHVISLGHFFETARKRCNSNVLNSMFETLAGELRATLLGNHADISTEEAADARNTSGATGKAKNQAAPA